MAIYPSEVPAAAIRAVSAGVVSSGTKAEFAPATLLGSVSGSLSLAMPHRIAYLPYDRIRSDLAFRTAAQTGSWRFLVYEKQTIDAKKAGAADERFSLIAAATAVAVADDFQFGEFNEGPFVEGTEEAVRRAETIPRVREGRFETFLLMVPSLYVVALWLQDLDGDGKTDLFLTIPPSHSDLVAFQPMNAVEFVRILNQLAAKALADATAR